MNAVLSLHFHQNRHNPHIFFTHTTAHPLSFYKVDILKDNFNMLRFHDADNIWRFMYCMKFIKEIFEKVKQRSSEVLLNSKKTI